jgi:hypothetical protein
MKNCSIFAAVLIESFNDRDYHIFAITSTNISVVVIIQSSLNGKETHSKKKSVKNDANTNTRKKEKSATKIAKTRSFLEMIA